MRLSASPPLLDAAAAARGRFCNIPFPFCFDILSESSTQWRALVMPWERPGAIVPLLPRLDWAAEALASLAYTPAVLPFTRIQDPVGEGTSADNGGPKQDMTGAPDSPSACSRLPLSCHALLA